MLLVFGLQRNKSNINIGDGSTVSVFGASERQAVVWPKQEQIQEVCQALLILTGPGQKERGSLFNLVFIWPRQS